MKNAEVFDARNREHITAEGSVLRGLLKSRIGALLDAKKALMVRMNNEVSSKEEAVTLIVALHGEASDLNERALFLRACAERAAYLESEISTLNILGTTFQPGREYRISLEDAIRFGL